MSTRPILPRVTPRAARAPQLPGSSPVAAGIQDVARGLGDAEKVAQAQYERQRRSLINGQVAAATNQMMALKTKLTTDPESGAFNRRFDAARGVTEEVTTALGQAADEIRLGLPVEARDSFVAWYSDDIARTQRQLATHEAEELHAFGIAEGESAIENLSIEGMQAIVPAGVSRDQDAIREEGSTVARIYLDILDRGKQLAEDQDLGPEMARDYVREKTSGYHSKIITSLIAAGRSADARQYLNMWKSPDRDGWGGMDAAAIETLDRRIDVAKKDDENAEIARGVTNEVVGSDADALVEMEQRVRDLGLPAEQENDVLGLVRHDHERRRHVEDLRDNEQREAWRFSIRTALEANPNAEWAQIKHLVSDPAHMDDAEKYFRFRRGLAPVDSDEGKVEEFRAMSREQLRAADWNDLREQYFPHMNEIDREIMREKYEIAAMNYRFDWSTTPGKELLKLGEAAGVVTKGQDAPQSGREDDYEILRKEFQARVEARLYQRGMKQQDDSVLIEVSEEMQDEMITRKESWWHRRETKHGHPSFAQPPEYASAIQDLGDVPASVRKTAYLQTQQMFNDAEFEMTEAEAITLFRHFVRREMGIPGAHDEWQEYYIMLRDRESEE